MKQGEEVLRADDLVPRPAQARELLQDPGLRKRRVRRTVLVCMLIAGTFYVGFIVMSIVRSLS